MSKKPLFTFLALACCLFFTWQLLRGTRSSADTNKETPWIHQESADNICDPNEPIRRVAIIGAGSGGASSAYFLSKFKTPCQRLNITIYERNDYVGGRSTTVNVYDDPDIPVELGASIFVEVNRNLVSAARSFGLSVTSYGDDKLENVPRRLGVWNGEKLVFSQYASSYRWWDTIKILWQYGTSPVRTNNLMKKTVGGFLKLYDDEMPFRSLSEVARRVGLQEAIGSSGGKFLAENSISEAFAKNIIQASTRVNYAQNLDQIHGLETMVCMATDGAMSVKGGNWQIFDGMIKASGAGLVLDTTVERIHKHGDKFLVKARSGPHVHEGSKGRTFSDDYDAVVLGAPLHLSNITISPTPINAPKPIPYVNLHVTLFTSPFRINPAALNLWQETSVPTTLLTTIPTDPEVSFKPPPFFSISTLRSVTNKKRSPHQKEYLYKIFSPAPMELHDLASLLIDDANPHVPVAANTGITWQHVKIWQSYPYLPPRTDFDELQLDGEDGMLWYTSGIESFISTMETSSLMGMNVAKLITQKWEKESLAVEERVKKVPEQDSEL